MKLKCALILTGILFMVSFQLTAQRGKDGAVTVTTANQILNEYTTLTVNAAAGSTNLQVASSGLNANGRFSSALAAGDLIYIIQVQGATIDGGSFWSGFGYISNYNNSGNNEFAQVLAVPNATTITLSCPLSKNYTVSGKVQVVRVPRLTTLTVNSGASVTCDTWNGATGGALVLEVSGLTNIIAGGEIHANAKGFRGGFNSDMLSITGSTIYASPNNTDGAEKGEGIAGNWADYDLIGGRYGKNAAANGGGGGNAHNGGGGGGGNGSKIYSWNGKGNPDTTTASWKAAWDLESANFHKNQSDGGGRGGYTFSWNDLDATLVGPNDVSWGGDNRRNEGGQGGRPLDYSGGRVFFGGGGGAGDQGPNTNWGGNGGNGGGLVYLLTYGQVNGSGQITSHGNPGTDAQGAAPFMDHGGIDGAGGGGAGGTIMVESAGNIAITITLSANGGKGGDQNKTRWLEAADGEAEGPGGGGGGGFLGITGGSPARITDGGNNGICYAESAADCGVNEFPPNGATKGGGGTAYSFLSVYSFAAANDTVCEGSTAQLWVVYTGAAPPGTLMQWYDAAVGGNLLGTGDTLLLPGIAASMTVYAGTCPGTYRIPVQVVVNAFGIDAGNDLYLCNGATDTLHASGGVTYSWLPSAPLSNAFSADPIVTVAATTEFFVSVTNSAGCTGVDSVMVYMNTVSAWVSNDTSVCAGQSLNLTSGGGTGYLWNTGDTTANINVLPATGQVYLVTVSADYCIDTAGVFVGVNPAPLVNLGNDTTTCDGFNLDLNAGNPGSAFLWQDGFSQQVYSVFMNGIYSVTVTNSFGCTAKDTLIVTVLPWANAFITQVPPLCFNAPEITLQAAQTGGTWSGTGITSSIGGIFNPSYAGIGNNEVYYIIPGLCGDFDQMTITVLEVASLTTTKGTDLCGATLNGWIDLSVSGGLPPYSILWSNGAVTEDLESVQTAGVYEVTVTDDNGCVAKTSELLEAPLVDCYEPHIYLPNVFSPDGDGFNDVLLLRGAGILTMQLVIYDRWGQKVFESTAMSLGWDGKISGSDCETGVYYYSLKAELSDGQQIKKGGNVTLLR